MRLKSIEDYNRNHALSQLNRAVSVTVWGLGLGAIATGFLDLTLPFIGPLPGSLGLNQSINNALGQIGLLLLFVNTNNVYEFYVSKLEYPLLCRLTGSSVYVAHLVAIYISVKNPSNWLWCVAGIIALRILANMQLYWAQKQQSQGHPWLGMLWGWLRRSFSLLLLVVVYAFLVQVLSNLPFYVWAFSLPGQDASVLPIERALLASIHTILNMIAVYRMGVRTFQQVNTTPSFSKIEVDDNYKALDKYHNEHDSSESP